ncbi:BnaA04g17320D [Brassica napus]|uniref:BnaA04g17320D protein n=1 Tax=Brassica napus TaxID=3708 RepID=A0A078GTA3_BRANA|nr:BnaA04g17320D [Brassica napus]
MDPNKAEMSRLEALPQGLLGEIATTKKKKKKKLPQQPVHARNYTSHLFFFPIIPLILGLPSSHHWLRNHY